MINIINCYILSRNPPLPLQQILTVHINTVQQFKKINRGEEEKKKGKEK